MVNTAVSRVFLNMLQALTSDWVYFYIIKCTGLNSILSLYHIQLSKRQKGFGSHCVLLLFVFSRLNLFGIRVVIIKLFPVLQRLNLFVSTEGSDIIGRSWPLGPNAPKGVESLVRSEARSRTVDFPRTELSGS